MVNFEANMDFLISQEAGIQEVIENIDIDAQTSIDCLKLMNRNIEDSIVNLSASEDLVINMLTMVKKDTQPFVLSESGIPGSLQVSQILKKNVLVKVKEENGKTYETLSTSQLANSNF
jgi:hypothetical protein